LAREAVAQTPFLVSGIGEIEAGLAFEGRLSTRYSLPCQADSQQRISYGRTFTHGATAAAAAFEVTRSQVHALGECAVNLSCIEAHDLGGSNRGPEDAEHGTGMKSPRQDGRDEIRPQSFHDLVAGHYTGQELAAGAARYLGSHERRGQDGATRVNHHSEGVPLAPGKHHLRIDERGSSSGEAPPVDECRGRAAATELFLLDEADGLHCFRKIMAEQA
jgi:hypothetical protein